MPKSTQYKKEQIINQLITEKLPVHSEKEKQLAREQLEEFLDLTSSIIINSQSRSPSLES